MLIYYIRAFLKTEFLEVPIKHSNSNFAGVLEYYDKKQYYCNIQKYFLFNYRGFMKRTFKFALAMLFSASLAFNFMPLLHAQEDIEDDTQEIQEEHENNDEIEYIYTENRKGDQNIRASMGPVLPLNFGNAFTSDGKLKLGGMGMLGYHYFIAKDLAVGIDIGFGFNTTIGSNVLHYVPVIGSIMWQPVIGRFEIPLTLGVGFAWETYAGYTYWPGLVLKPSVGVHYRLTPSWSIGGDIEYMFMPQFAKFWGTGDKNFFANFIGISAVVRYYF